MATHRTLSRPSGRWAHDHMLSIVLFILFIVSWIGQLVFQYLHELDEARQHGTETLSMWSSGFLHSFLASTLENWQSEFLQLFTFVVLATYLIHRESPQSRDGDDEMSEDIKAIRKHLGV